MSVVNGKHVILRSDVEKYRDVSIMQECAVIAEKEGVNPSLILQLYKNGEDKKLVEIVNKNVEQYLDIMVEELNKLIDELNE